MSIAAERILRKAVWDLVSTVEVECLVTDYGLPTPDSASRTAEAAVRHLMEAGLVVVGLPVTGPVPFPAWSDDPKVAMDMLASEWASGRLDRGETFAWLELTAAGKREADRLVSDRRRCEQHVTEELCRRHAELSTGLNLAEASDAARLTFASIAAEVAGGKAPPWRPGLEPDVLKSVANSIDALCEHGDACTRELILDEVVGNHAAPYRAENNDVLLTRLGPRLCEVIREHDKAGW